MSATDSSSQRSAGSQEVATSTEGSAFVAAGIAPDQYADGRKAWEWKTKYSPEARHSLNCEAGCLVAIFFFLIALEGALLGMSGQTLKFTLSTAKAAVAPGGELAPAMFFTIDFRLLATFFAGTLGSATFSIKWLVHSVAKGKWHLDRRYWRFMTPLLGGVYACILLALFDAGVHGGGAHTSERTMSATVAYAFLIGYVADGVGGLLSNIAGAIFGTLEKK